MEASLRHWLNLYLAGAARGAKAQSGWMSMNSKGISLAAMGERMGIKANLNRESRPFVPGF